MIEAIEVYVRYCTIDENGETRREVNDRFGRDETDAPPLLIPAAGHHIWDWFFEASEGLTRVHDWFCARIPWTEWAAWHSETGHIVRPSEHGILRAMDDAYCVAMNTELAAARIRAAEKAEKERDKK